MGFIDSSADGNSATSQVGWVLGPTMGGYPHAALWRDTSSSFVDLNPAGFIQSVASAVSDGVIVGNGSEPDGPPHALLWHGTADSVVDLHSTDYLDTFASDVSGNSQVGGGRSARGASFKHALLWHGTAASLVDLRPGGFFVESVAIAVSGDTQVGYGKRGIPFLEEALLWHGTRESVVNLRQYLSELDLGLTSSEAQSIAANGDIVGYGYNNSTGNYYAVKWSLVPEPNSCGLMFCGLVVAFVPRMRPHRK